MRLHEHARRMGKARVRQRFVDRLVGIDVIDVLADDRDRDFLLGMPDFVHQLLPIINLQRPRIEAAAFR